MLCGALDARSVRLMLRSVEMEVGRLERLRSGDEEAFVLLVSQYHQPMIRLARSLVASDAVAEEIVQDTWAGVVRGIDQFEGRSSLKTWLFAILINRARSAGSKEHPNTPIESLHAVDPVRFDVNGQWADPLDRWQDDLETRLDTERLMPMLGSALDDLPSRQRQVVLLRDVEGLTPDETCSALGLSVSNQRVLLHRGRSRLRELLESQIGRVK
jgi:RNA polymerase sigma-70 factor, ECF subfamily